MDDKIFENYFFNNNESIVITNKDGLIKKHNKQFEVLSGYKKNKIINNKSINDFIVGNLFNGDESSEIISQKIYDFKDKRDNIKQCLVVYVTLPGTDDKLISLVDISVFKKIFSEYKFLNKIQDIIIKNAMMFIIMIDMDGKIISANEKIEEITGYKKSELIGKNIVKQLLPKSYQNESINFLYKKINILSEIPLLRKDNELRYLRYNKININDQKDNYILYMGMDITEVKIKEEKLRHSLEIENTLTDISKMIVNSNNNDIDGVLTALGKLVKVNRSYIFQFRNKLSKMDNTYEWCSCNTDSQKENLQDLDSNIFPWWMEKLKKNESIITNDINNMPDGAKNEQEILKKQNIKSLIVVPLFNREKELLGFMGFDDTEKIRNWSNEDIKALNFVGDMIVSCWTREKNEKLLADSLESIIYTLSTITSVRNPYTEKHAQKVFILANYIACKLNYSEKECKNIKIAALLHDIGKIEVPPDILNKPGKLTELEYKLVQEHVKAGYNLIKNIKFDSIVSEIILQHHERLDGSGYPRGLTAKKILKEAMIVSVADVVESMISNRPYRTALDKELVIKEISNEKKYDQKIAKVCIQLLEDDRIEEMLNNDK